MSTPRLTLYILSHDRPSMLERCLKSIKKQSSQDFLVIVSDNSISKKEQVKVVVSRFREVLLKNSQAKSGVAHINEILKKSEGWFAILHDDDFLAEDFVREQQELCKDGNSAVTCKQKISTKEGCVDVIGLSGRLKKITTEDLHRSYFSVIKNITAPAFPSYIYNSRLVKGLYLDLSLGGKHCDVPFIMQVSKRGEGIMYNPNALYVTEVHNDSDSNVESLNDRLSLVRWAASSQGFYLRYIGYILHSIFRLIILKH